MAIWIIRILIKIISVIIVNEPAAFLTSGIVIVSAVTAENYIVISIIIFILYSLPAAFAGSCVGIIALLTHYSIAHCVYLLIVKFAAAA